MKTSRKSMPYTHTLPKVPSFTGAGLEGYSFGPLRQKDLDVYYIESVKGHDTFVVSRKIARTYYVLSGNGYFTIENRRYDVSPGMLVEVPPKVEYSYSGKMTLIGFARPRWFSGNDTHTRWNPDVTCRRCAASLPGRESRLERLARFSVAGKSPVHSFLRLNRRLWNHLPPNVCRRGPVRSYGGLVHALARINSARGQAFSTNFLRNRPELDLIQRLLNRKTLGEKLKVAVLGCSYGAEAYSVAWAILSARPDLKLIMSAVDISPQAVHFAQRGVYSLADSEVTSTWIFERMTAAEKEEFFEMDGQNAKVRPWIREGIRWNAGDVGEPEIIEALGSQDMVVANNFLCHMSPSEAERCLRNIARLVSSEGYLFVSGIDLDVRTKVARDLKWRAVLELLEEVHEGDPCLRAHWPWHYGGLEPLNKQRQDCKMRYAAAFQLPRFSDQEKGVSVSLISNFSL
ncbi:MAG: methyltransferase domain-containing protein [Acidobacteriota bacterium]|nr:methyltransferase domain-containing protein [Acidobacteriota bacterium]